MKKGKEEKISLYGLEGTAFKAPLGSDRVFKSAWKVERVSILKDSRQVSML